MGPKNQSQPRKRIALLIPAHNEELVLEATVTSALNAGQSKHDIFIVNDGSRDNTESIALRLVGPTNVLSTHQGGKARALQAGARHFDLTKRYSWIHIADADGHFETDYFKILRKELRVKYPAATGYVKSMHGSLISAYRVIEYTWGMEFVRRFQAWFGLISIIPGPTSIFRSDTFENIEFGHQLLTEDFDFTLQIHRKNLGYIQFIPKAKVQTQDPGSFRDYVKQILRWNRGTWQIIRFRKIGFGRQRIDAYLAFQVIQNFMFFAVYAAVLPYLAIHNHAWLLVSTAFLYDVALFLLLTGFVAYYTRRYEIISAFPFLYMFRLVSICIFMIACFEIMVLRRWQPRAAKTIGWDSPRHKAA